LTVACHVKNVMLAGNAYSALKDITASAGNVRGRRVVDTSMSGSLAWFSGLFPYVQVGELNVTG
jgi:predicted Zn-dependent protease